ncbi:MAG: hypothetical protein QOJ40_2546 [Verrucomicrobiota bacterium]
MKATYVCPPDAGPAWRAAWEAGFDMAEIEENLRLTPEQRMEKHQRILDEFLDREHFLEVLRRGRSFIQKYVHSR